MIQDHFEMLSWERVAFGKVVLNKNENTSNPFLEGLSRVVGLDHMDSESLPLVRWSELSELLDGTTFTRKFKSGQVLFGKRRCYQKKVSVPDFDGICSGDILVFESLDVNRMLPNFLPLLVQSDLFMDFAISTSAGSLSPRTKWSDLASFEFLLPPLKEQKVIIEIVGAIDKTIDAYKNLSIRSFRESIVHELLTAQGDGWTETTIGEIAEVKGGKRLPKGTPWSEIPTDHPYIRATDIRDGIVDVNNLVYVPDSVWSTISRYVVNSGDVLITIAGTIGAIGIVPESHVGANLTENAALIRPNIELILPRFLQIFLMHTNAQAQIETLTIGTTQKKLGLFRIESIEIQLPTLAEQERIVEIVSSMDEALQSTEQAVVDAKSLRLSILGEIFKDHNRA